MKKDILLRAAARLWFALYLVVSWAPVLQEGVTILTLLYSGIMTALIALVVFARSPKALLVLFCMGILYTLYAMWVYNLRFGRVTVALPIISYYAASRPLGVSLKPILSRFSSESR